MPRILRAFEVSQADALFVGVKYDRLELPSVHISVPGGVEDLRDGSVVPVNDFPDIVVPTVTPGFSDGMRAILRACGVPFFTALQLVPELGQSFTMAQYEAASRAWIGEDLLPLWFGNAGRATFTG